MLKSRDWAAEIEEPKTARMEQLTKPHVKAQIQQAAALLGVDETTFVTSVALERARETIKNYERTSMSTEARAVVLSALESPAEPTDELRDAMAQQRERVTHSG